MADYINREAALVFMEARREQIKKQMDDALAYEHFHTRSDLKCALSQLEDDIFLLESMGAADVREMVRGRWLRREVLPDTAECKCSNCGYTDYPHRNDIYWFRRKFCPFCGADMREVDDGSPDV